MKTIKQIADELGVSKQSVRDKIAKLNLQSTLQKNGNQFAINEKQESLIKSAFEGKNANQNDKDFAKENAKFFDANFAFLKHLQEENLYLRSENEKLLEALHAEQTLHAETKGMLPMLQQPQKVGLFQRIKGHFNGEKIY